MMDFLLPFPPVRPSPVNPKSKSKTTKLSLADKWKNRELQRKNASQAPCSRNKPTVNTGAKDKREDRLSSLISSDNSDDDSEEFANSKLYGGSSFSVPKAESTRLECNWLNDETNQASFYSCKSKLVGSSNNSAESEAACEESIICISDDEDTSLPKFNLDTKDEQSLIDKTNSYEKTPHSKNGFIDDKYRTIVLETSSEEDSDSLIKRHLTGKKLLSDLNNAAKKTSGFEFREIVIPSSSSHSDSEIIDASVQPYWQAQTKPAAEGSHTKNNQSSLSKKERLIIPESSDSKELVEDNEDSPEMSTKDIIAEKLSNTKIADINRWLQCSDSSANESNEIPHESVKTISGNSKGLEEVHQTKNVVIPESTSSDDSFDKLLQRDKRNLPTETPIKSSFINDSSSTDESFHLYRKDLAKTVKDDAKNILRTPFSNVQAETQRTTSRRKPRRFELSSESASESDTESSSDWEPGVSSIKNRGKPLKKHVRRKPRKVFSDDSETEPKDLKKPVEAIKTTPFVTPKTAPKKSSKIHELKKDSTPYSPIRTFLTSLAGPPKVSGMRNHPEASIYYKNYKSKKEELARRLFKLYNREVFESRLPDDIPLEWNARMVSTAGYCKCRLIKRTEGNIRTVRIVLSSKILDSSDRLRDTLIHELCHAAVWLLNNISGGHGPFWKSWAAKAEKRFPELPPIKRCHEYQIETKFTYKCTGCGYSFGRHSKSINLKTQRCGHCYGTFEILVNKQGRTQDGRPLQTPSTPKPPTGFALFVKENYGSVKKDHQDKKHGDIMKLLGQKFAEVKINR